MLDSLIETLQKMKKDGSIVVGGTINYMKDGEIKFIELNPQRKTANHWSKINFK
jgi:hypothetical protein